MHSLELRNIRWTDTCHRFRETGYTFRAWWQSRAINTTSRAFDVSVKSVGGKEFKAPEPAASPSVIILSPGRRLGLGPPVTQTPDISHFKSVRRLLIDAPDIGRGVAAADAADCPSGRPLSIHLIVPSLSRVLELFSAAERTEQPASQTFGANGRTDGRTRIMFLSSFPSLFLFHLQLPRTNERERREDL